MVASIALRPGVISDRGSTYTGRDEVATRQIGFASALAVMILSTASITFAQAGPPGGMIYANDELFRTVGTPTDLPNHGPFDAIYVLGDGLAAVSESAPDDQDYNGGRWEVRIVTFETIAPTQFTNADDLLDAASRGEISVGPVVRRFVCPLIRSR
jgi:hypothetical protein